MNPSTHRRCAGRGIAVAAALLWSSVVIGCEPAGTPEPAAGFAALRLVSLSPAVTQMLLELGQADRIVALGAFDPAALPAASVVGDLYRIDYERLIELSPTHLFLQPGRGGVPGRLAELAARHGWHLHSFDIELREDALTALASESGPSVGTALDLADAAAALRRRVEQEWDAIRAATADAVRRPTLIVVGRSPLTAAGPETFLGQMLEAAGGVNVLEAAGGRYPVIDRERLLLLDPELILRVRPTDEAEQAAAPLNVPESMRDRVITVSDPLALLPGPHMPRVLAQIARKLHGDRAARIDAALREPQP